MARPGSGGRLMDASRFAMVARPDVPRSAFDVVHGHKTTFDAGWLVPVYVDEVLPGDSIRVRMTAFARLAVPITPVLDNLILESFFFFVPNRLVWQNWARFMGEQAAPDDSTVFLVPTADFSPAQLSTLLPSNPDYMGVYNNGVATGVDRRVSALPFRALHLIWNEWFRDQDLQDPVAVQTDDGPDDGGLYVGVLFRGKRHDYFTSARPWPQKPINAQIFSNQAMGGDMAPGGNMRLPNAGAPVTGIGVFDSQVSSVTGGVSEYYGPGGRVATVAEWPAHHLGTNLRARSWGVAAADSGGEPDIRVLINDIRTANVVQLLMERNARGGSRYAEIIRSHFGVVSPDSRLQRPEFLGGGRTFVNVNPVVQQSATGITGSTTVLGELAGIGTAVARNHGFSGSFTEHGVLIGLVSVRADLNYQQGIERFWHRRTQFDFYWPALAHLGEQTIIQREIFAQTDDAGDGDVFGYQERWAEYRHKPSRVSGRFRSNTAMTGGTLDVWHFAQEFATAPVLGNDFIIENPPVDRVLQVAGTAAEQFLFDSVFEIRYVRPIPMFSVPGLGPRL